MKYILRLILFIFLILLFTLASKVVSKPLPEGLPDDINNYNKWTRLNKKVIKPRSADPHRGFKRIYINKEQSEFVDSSRNLVFPYPEGTIIVKEVSKTAKRKSIITLISIMRKQAGNDTTGGWDFIEYTRLSDSSFSPINFPKESCFACHQGASDSDSVWTKFDNFK